MPETQHNRSYAAVNWRTPLREGHPEYYGVTYHDNLIVRRCRHRHSTATFALDCARRRDSEAKK